MKKLAFIDVETTGLQPHLHTICEVAIIRSDGATFSTKVKLTPDEMNAADKRALQINGYTAKDMLYALSHEKSAAAFAEILQGCKVVGHNVHFDVAFIREWFDQHGIECSFDPRLIDTQVIAFEQLPFLRSHSLDNLRRFFCWSLEGAHTALIDAHDCKRLYHKINRATVLHRVFWRCKRWLRKLRNCNCSR
jgi:DNA polymerase III alpha subunit (gram-positive type)